MLEPIPWTTVDLIQALGLDGFKDLPEKFFSRISTDSRTIVPGELFVALKGDRFDAHHFVADLVEKGIQGFVVDKEFLKHQKVTTKQAFNIGGAFVLEVDDTLAALGSLARFQRLRAGVRVLAITGSSGKTTTKEMAAAIFKTRFSTLATQGNLNNEIGLPLTLLNLSKGHDWAVVELGMNHPGEIDRLAGIALPDLGIITNTAAVHLEGVGTVEGVARAKAELMAGIGTEGKHGISILNVDDPRYSILNDTALENENIDHQITFGFSEKADVRATEIEIQNKEICFTLCRNVEHKREQMERIRLHTPGTFMVENALAAAAAALAAGLGEDEIRRGLQNFKSAPGRLNLKTMGKDIKIIDDTYNANPLSVACALDTLEAMGQGQKLVAVLGDMLELGESSPLLHKDVGRKAARCGVSRLYAHGEMAKQVIAGAVAQGLSQDHCFGGNHQEIVDHIRSHVEPGSWILIKGSRGMKMEMVVTRLMDL